jgi:hypothetical protein
MFEIIGKSVLQLKIWEAIMYQKVSLQSKEQYLTFLKLNYKNTTTVLQKSQYIIVNIQINTFWWQRPI